MLFHRAKQREEIQMLIYMITLRESEAYNEVLEKIVQLGQ